MPYIPRLADEQLQSALARMGGVLVEGPKACGKTKTASQASGSIVHLDTDPEAAGLYAIDPHLLLEGGVPRLLDEWQNYPELWNYVRRAIDERKDTGQFILTGSTAAVADHTRHSGAGRIARLRMRTLSMYETGHSDGSVSLEGLLTGERPSSGGPGQDFRELLERMSRGGWPGHQHLPQETARENLRDYVDTIAEVDIRTPDGVSRSPQRVRRLLTALARSTASEVTLTALTKDVGESARDTVRDHWDALNRIFIAEPQPAWSTHLRSSATLRKEPKRHLADPGLACAALGIGPEALMKDLNFVGQLFESQVVHDLRVYSDLIRGRVFHARDSKNRELDAVVQCDDGTWHGFEVKLGSRPEVIDVAAQGLQRFAANVDSELPLSGLSVITTGRYSYRHPTYSNVNMVSVHHLGP